MILLIDLGKAFNKVRRKCTWNALRSRGDPEKFIVIISAAYENANCYGYIEVKFLEKFQCKMESDKVAFYRR